MRSSGGGRRPLDARQDSAYDKSLRHRKAIGLLLEKLKFWGAAAGVEIRTDAALFTQKEEDPDLDYNGLYSLQSNREFDVPIGKSGFTMKAPFSFVERLDITRKEVYDFEATWEEAHNNE